MALAMGTWGSGPFENDAASDLLLELGESDVPADAVAALLEGIATMERGEYLDVDDGQACVAVAELIALAFGPGTRPKQVAPLIAALETDPSLVQRALEALPRVLDKRNSELAQLWPQLDHLDALYERLVELREARSSLPPLDLGGLLAPRRSPPVGRPPPQPWSTTPPDVRALVESSEALASTTAAWAGAWVLTTHGVLNVYDDLTPADLEKLARQRVTQVQFARRFKVEPTTLARLDELFAAQPRLVLHLQLNGFGAFDDLEVLHQLPHLRDLVVQGRFMMEGAGTILERFPTLVRVVVEGTEARRAR